MEYIGIFLVWNIVVFGVYGYDKHCAQIGAWRVRESSLILIAFAMGGVGAFAGMKHFRHKTKHTIFKISIPLAIVMNIVTAYSVWKFS